MRELGFCHYCKKVYGVHSVTEEQAAAIAEDAQCSEDYYRMDNHVNAEGKPCQGIDKAPEWLETRGGYSEEFLDHLDDFEDPEEDGWYS